MRAGEIIFAHAPGELFQDPFLAPDLGWVNLGAPASVWNSHECKTTELTLTSTRSEGGQASSCVTAGTGVHGPRLFILDQSVLNTQCRQQRAGQFCFSENLLVQV